MPPHLSTSIHDLVKLKCQEIIDNLKLMPCLTKLLQLTTFRLIYIKMSSCGLNTGMKDSMSLVNDVVNNALFHSSPHIRFTWIMAIKMERERERERERSNAVWSVHATHSGRRPTDSHLTVNQHSTVLPSAININHHHTSLSVGVCFTCQSFSTSIIITRHSLCVCVCHMSIILNINHHHTSLSVCVSHVNHSQHQSSSHVTHCVCITCQSF